MNATIRKRLLGEEGTTSPSRTDEIELATCARIAYSSEDPSHPVENLFDRRFGPAATCWKGARPDVTDRIIIEFDQAQPISKLIYEVEETECQRTQEVQVEVSSDGGQTYQGIVVQEYTFSPRGATFQREDQRLPPRKVTHMRLTIIPNKSGSGRATLTSLRLFG